MAEPRDTTWPARREWRRRPVRRRSRIVWAVAIVVFWLLILAALVLFGASVWVRRTFGKISIDQLLSNMGGGGEGAGGSELIVGAVVIAIVVPVLVVAALIVLTEAVRRAIRKRRETPRHAARPRWSMRLRPLRVVAFLVAIAVPVGAVGYAASTVSARDYVEATIREAVTGTDLADYYVEPPVAEPAGLSASARGADAGGGSGSGAGGATGADAGTAAEKPKNLVLIYLESVEDALADDEVFEKNMLEPIQAATEGWDTIPSLHQYEGGGWTMAGVVSTQCGIPLRSANAATGSEELNLLGSDGNAIDTYMPGATCLGDVLSAEGYNNVYLGGANAQFAGKGAFLATHGYSEIKDLNTWKSLGETEIREDWGLSDRRLMDYAKAEVTRLHDAGQPFNLTMLTLDTHESPRVYQYCDWNTDVAMTSITYCSMQQVQGFIDYMKQQGYLEDTVVMVMGDHQKMIAPGGSFWNELKNRGDRTIYNRVWAPGGVDFARDEIDQFSMYPTLLELMDVKLPDHRAGLGVSALADPSDVPAGSPLDLSEEDYDLVVRSRATEFYEDIWAPDPVPTATPSTG